MNNKKINNFYIVSLPRTINLRRMHKEQICNAATIKKKNNKKIGKISKERVYVMQVKRSAKCDNIIVINIIKFTVMLFVSINNINFIY